MRGSGRLLAAGVCFFLLGAGGAGAAELAVSLRYAVPSACPDAAGFKTTVTSRLGYDPFREDAVDQVLVRITPRSPEPQGRLDGRIEWRDAQGKWAGDQSFPSTSADCPRLARAMGLALAVQIQLLAGTRAAVPVDAAPVAPAPDEASPSAPASAAPRPAEPSAPSPPPAVAVVTDAAVPPVAAVGPVFAVGVGPALGFGMSSVPVGLGRVFGAALWPRLSVELGAQASLATTPRRKDGAGFSQRLTLVTAAGCAGGARWSGCVLMAAGVVRMAGQDIDVARSDWAPVVNAGARVGLTQRLGQRAFLYAHADGLANVVRWTGRLDDVPVWTAPPFAAAFGIDAGIRFP